MRSAVVHARQQSKPAIQAKSAHVADPFLHEFLSPSFDAAAYLNTTLPPLQASNRAGHNSASRQEAVPLADVSIQAQTVLSQLNAHTTRLTNTLTELTNDILRSGGRLAYEVELLRGETLGLAETLSEGLDDEIAKFVPGDIKESIAGPRATVSASADSHGPVSHKRRLSVVPPLAAAAAAATAAENTAAHPGAAEMAPPDEPPYISQLRTLTLVRSRLDSVIKTFGDAMEFVFPPSEVSVGSSFLSVSAPDAGGENHSTEEKGQQVLQSLRDEISRLLNNTSDPIKGIEDAAHRIEELKELATVWKGTAEEKGRTKFIESLAKMVEDRHRELLRDVEQSSRRDNAKPEMDASSRRTNADADSNQPENKGYGAYGLISQLQKLRNGL
ncbi:Laminin subunit beta-4 [Madurella mycetomatis]|uniref:Laminin subunit beta-4 n=1 Tax=Madurella mycetomatis TaxID=100816 RepID=A0A175WE45_9PEZI|nr:Laminin subunit beta-4 [Madurella mycetomatis]